ncbi:MAG TPA: hypothetical protein VNH17_02075 [Streptosporangiaceae bacterium]|nr:hypothetical protein [Streptosporangiaceae bacterium]
MASTVKLLELAADALERGEDPFSTAFLGKHEVEFDQCMSMAEQLAIGARIVARALTHVPGRPGPELLAYVAVIGRKVAP